MAFTNTFAEWATNGVKAAPSETLQSTGFQGGMKPPASVFNYQWDKMGKAITELQTAVTANTTAIAGHETDIGNLETAVGTTQSAMAPYSYVYDTDGDVLGMVRSVSSYTKTAKLIPYNVDSDYVTNKARCYSDSSHEYYAEMETTTTSRTAKLYIDMEIPQSASISSLTINAKVGSSNISSSVWTTRTYSVKSGSNVLGSGSFTLSTSGSVITVSVTDMTKIVSPIIVIELTAQTTNTQNVRIYGADVAITYTASQKYVSLVRQNKAATDYIGGEAITTDQIDEWNGKQDQHTTATASLATASWSSLSQTVSVTGVTASNTVICTPAPASHDAYCKAGVYCSAQASGTLTFKCTTTPTAALTVNVMILGG